MSGAAIVTTLLSANSNLTAVVSASNILSGYVSGNPLPAISVTKVTGQQENTLKMGESSYLVSQRVQVTVFASTEGSAKSIMALVRAALPYTRGTVGSFACQSILPDSEGPDFYDPSSKLAQQSQDYIVWFDR